MYKPLSVLWVTEYGCNTGYSMVSQNIIDRLHDIGRDRGNPHYQMTVMALGLRVNPMNPQPIPRPYRVIPAFGDPNDIHCRNTLRPVIEDVKPNIVCFTNDIWGMEHVNDTNVIPAKLRKTFKALSYLAIDADPVPPSWITRMHKFDHTVFFSKFAYNQIIHRDKSMQDKCSMIYHGINPYLYHPLRREHIDRFKKNNGMENKFVVGMVARNQARKAHPRLLLAWQKFAQGKEDVMLLMHCCPQDQGWDLGDLVNRFGLNQKVRITMPHNNPAQGVPQDQMVMLYNAMDVHVLTTEGEGFGIPVLESMACGIPNITDDYAASAELVKEAEGGLLTPAITRVFRGADHNFDRPSTDIDKLAEQFQWMYEHPEERRQMGRQARGYAQTMSYDLLNLQWDRLLQRVWNTKDYMIEGAKI